VLGETVPVWLPSALALIGLIGSIVTARLLFTDWLDGFELFSERAEIGASATQVAPPETVAVGEEIPETPGRPDETEGSLGRENDRLPAATETGLVAEQTSATLSTAKSPPPVSAAREPAPDDSSAMKGSTVRAVSVKQAEGGRASIQQIGERPKREADMRTMAAAAKDETPSGIGSASDTAVQAGPAGSLVPSMDAGARTDATRSTSIASASQAIPEASAVTIADTGPGTSGAAGPEQAGSPLTRSKPADTVWSQDSHQTSRTITVGQSNAVRAQPCHGGDTDSDPPLDESTIDCAPLFSVSFSHGSVTPRDRNMDKKIGRLARWLNAHPGVIIYVDGHADSSGPEETNLVISYRRAVAIADLLAEAGISKAQLVVRAYGEGSSRLLSSESEPERRVTLKIDAGLLSDPHASNDGGIR